MSVPVAISPSQRSPGIGTKVNLLAGASSPGTGALRVLMLAVKSSAGSITPDTQLVEGVGSVDDFKTYLGGGTPGHVSAKALFAEYGLIQCDLVAMAVGGGVAATLDLTFAGTVTVARTVTMKIMGRRITTTWAAGVTPTAFVAALVILINALSDDISVTASGVAGVLTLTAKFAGTWGNDIVVYVSLTDGSGGTVNGGSTVTTKVGTTIAGTTAADPTNALALVTTREYAYILLVDGNTSVNTSGSSTSYGKLDTHIATYQAGMNALLQQSVLGYTGTQTAATTSGGYRNTVTDELAFFQSAQSLPCEVAAAELGQRLREVSLYPVKNRCKMPYRATLYGPLDDVGEKLTPAEIESCLFSGVTPIDWGGDGVPFPVRPVTTYFQDSNGNADDRCLDVSRVDGTYFCARDQRAFYPQEFPGLNIINDLAAGQELPRECVEIKTIRAAGIARARFYALPLGIVQADALEAAIANNEFIIQRDPSNANMVDIFTPYKIVRHLLLFSNYVVQKN